MELRESCPLLCGQRISATTFHRGPRHLQILATAFHRDPQHLRVFTTTLHRGPRHLRDLVKPGTGDDQSSKTGQRGFCWLSQVRPSSSESMGRWGNCVGKLGDHEPEVVVGVVVLAQAERMGAGHAAYPLASFGITGGESIDGAGSSIFHTCRADRAELQGRFGVWSIFETQGRDTFPRLLTRGRA